MSGRRIARDFGISRDSVAKMLAYSEPPGYRRTAAIKRPKLDSYTDQIEHWLAEDKDRPRKQRHTAKRIFERLRDECGFDGGYTIVKDYVRGQKRGSREMFVPLSHPPGHGQADFGEALVVIGGVEQNELPLVCRRLRSKDTGLWERTNVETDIHPRCANVLCGWYS
ncbi:MAG: hypothetical protein ABJG55_07095, partial [Paracoccaceae bacterium]